eukprot:7501129-Pyramimonas_sp.AAC.1
MEIPLEIVATARRGAPVSKSPRPIIGNLTTHAPSEITFADAPATAIEMKVGPAIRAPVGDGPFETIATED